MSDLLPTSLRGVFAAVIAFFICLSVSTATNASSDAKVSKTMRQTADILPPTALGAKTYHPLDSKIHTFLARQSQVKDFQPSGFSGKDYLKFIDGQVKVFRKCQDESGAIIDPVQKIEWQYSTPCYALSVGLLAATGYDKDPDLLQSGIKAMDLSVREMNEYRCAHNHGEFFIQPVMLALDMFRPFVSKEQLATWEQKLSELDPYKLYPDNLQRKKTVYNHNIVALSGEYMLIKDGLKGDEDFFETHLSTQTKFLNQFGMYIDNATYPPIVYDEFSRQYLAAILVEGYNGPFFTNYRDAVWKGAWTSLFMQSPFGECPTGGRSAQHIWNEAECTVTYEIYASQYARKGRMAEAGAFKRAAHKSLACMDHWLRPDGTGYIVKNRYPIEAQHGYEGYSAQSQYNLLACWLLAVAYVYADDTIPEKACPSEIGGFVVPILDVFNKVFANASGTYVEYDTNANLHYNPTGLIRCHVKGTNPQLGPSDGVVHMFDKKTKEDLGGENLCTGPAWQDAGGNWHRLADYEPTEQATVEVLDETPTKARFRVTYDGDFDGAKRIVETITVEPTGVTVEDVVQGDNLKAMRVYYPMLVFDGLEEAKVRMAKNAVTLTLWDGSVRYELLEPAGIDLQRTGKQLYHRNGMAEAAYADLPGFRAVYRISQAK